MPETDIALGLAPDALYRACLPTHVAVEETDEIDEIDLMFGQDRAAEALRVGVGVSAQGYNVFALGPSETDKAPLIRRLLEQKATDKEPPSDWCYVFNFEHPNEPQALRLPAGQGPALQADMEQFVEDLQTGLAAAFESEEYQTRRQLIVDEFQQEHQKALSELNDKAEEKGLAFLHTPTGFLFVPIREGSVLSPEEINNLPTEEQERLKAAVEELQEKLLHILRGMPAHQREMSQRIRDLNRDVARYAVEDLIRDLRATYESHEDVRSYLDAVEADIVENVNVLLPQVIGMTGSFQESLRGGLQRYTVNPLVTHEHSTGAPVVYEDRPSLRQLMGRSENRIEDGVLVTDFTLLRPGALHRANGGYLMIDARRILQQPFAWEALKRTLRAGEIRIQSPYEEIGLVSTVSLDPEPIPLDVKIVLIGDRWLYYLLQALDARRRRAGRIWDGCLHRLPVRAPPEENATDAQSQTERPFVQARSAVEAGRYLAIVGQCNDCHTEGYLQTEGKIPEEDWLAGSNLGWRGPWGTTYPTNLRLRVQEMSKEAWVNQIHNRHANPPMPWANVNQLSDRDAQALYEYIKSLGPKGDPVPQAVPRARSRQHPTSRWIPKCPRARKHPRTVLLKTPSRHLWDRRPCEPSQRKTSEISGHALQHAIEGRRCFAPR